jgi:hypothetical protein
MWTTLALAVALGSALGQSDQISISNVRATYGILGGVRPDNRLLPGDTYFLSFDINGLKVDKAGKVAYSMGMEVTNSKGKVIYGREPQKLEQFISLGGSRMPVFTWVDANINQEPGEYTITVSVADRVTNKRQSLTRKFETLPKDFGLVRLMTTYDPDGHQSAPPMGVAGQRLYINFFAVGFERDPKRKQPDVAVEMRVLDEDGKPTVADPFEGGVSDKVAQDVLGIPMSFTLDLNRPGKFTVLLNATDRVSKKTSKLSLPITVIEQKASDTAEQK